MSLSSFISSRLGSFTIHEGPKTGWRVRSKLAVRGTVEAPLIGLFKEGTHDVYELIDCPDHHPHINQAAQLVKSWMMRHKILPYNEKGHGGILKYLQFVVERHSGKVQASFVVRKKEGFADLLKLLLKESPQDFWHSLWINFHPEPSNTIFSTHWQLVEGKEWLYETIAGVRACFLPGSFGQANLEMFEKLLHNAKPLVQPQRKALELYAGIGIIGLSMADQLSSLDLCENNPESKKCFDEMMDTTPYHNVQYHLVAAKESLDFLGNADLLIVDPPRKGLEGSLIEKLPSTLQELLYISCGADSFMRDTLLLEHKGWKLVSAEGFLFFPGTPHIETLAFFKKAAL